MRVAITFCDQSERERCSNEHCYSSFSRREAESLPHFIEFKTPAPFNQVANPSFKWVVVKTVDYYTEVLLGECLSKSASFVSQRFNRV